MSTFTIGSLVLNYRSTNEHTERNLEVPLGVWFLSKFPNAIEVGEVMAWRGCANHRCYDPQGTKGNTTRMDAEQLNMIGMDVLSISTVEHMGLGDYGNTDIDSLKPERFVRKVIQEAAHYLITVPAGFNSKAMEFVNAIENKIVMVCESIGPDGFGVWKQTDSRFSDHPYDRHGTGASAVAVIHNCIPTL